MERLSLGIMSLFFIVLFASPVLAAAVDDYGDFWSAEYFWTQVLVLPREWLPYESIQNFLMSFLVPFLGLYMILLGLIKKVEIFRGFKWIEATIAFVMTFLTLPSKIFITIVSIAFGVMGIWGFGVFFFVFVLGSYFWGIGNIRRGKSFADIHAIYGRQLKSAEQEEKDAYVKYRQAIDDENDAVKNHKVGSRPALEAEKRVQARKTEWNEAKLRVSKIKKDMVTV